MPAGADTVFMQEDVRRDGAAVIVPPGLKLGANRRLAGEDVPKGSVALPAGRRVTQAVDREPDDAQQYRHREHRRDEESAEQRQRGERHTARAAIGRDGRGEQTH